ncbi:hypothetical protein GCM10010260_31950 [Streptomyces filipinensis]|uniref:Uncharacterized protein n=1 Tax=Streptomyces filipinensis TaxID=66887 RepID=A0A918ICC0_9ACTN|nr:hypothetical protein [Streptomyces filipinensis]GGU94456.1 hypothetical protein GCM10010260_31950 [Streptomyces filipinensis]
MTPRPEKPTAPTSERLRPAGHGADGGRGTKSDGRQAVLSALRSGPHPTGHARPDGEDPTPDRPGIRIYAPPFYRHHYDGARWSKRYGDTPTAAYACPCGQTGTARGRDDVAALVTDYAAHKHFCTGTPVTHTERRNAA